MAYEGVNQSGPVNGATPLANGSVTVTCSWVGSSNRLQVSRSLPIVSFVPLSAQVETGTAWAGIGANATRPRATQSEATNLNISVLPKCRDQYPSSWTVANLHPYGRFRACFFCLYVNS